MEESFPMTGGDGPFSYAKNSDRQKLSAEGVKTILVTAIHENLEIKHLPSPSSTSFRIVDLGCSTGPNTFMAMNTIVEAVITKYQKETTFTNLPEFQVFFNDHVSNDFNTLFANIPSNKQYFYAAAPGSFHGRLFPKASIDFVYSSSALHWISKVPHEVCDPKSPAFNRGKIHYSGAPSEVGSAYAARYAMDMEAFLSARAEEVVPGGLMALNLPGRPDGMLPENCSIGHLLKPLESSLVDMVNEGVLSRDKLDRFNLPVYSPSPEELRVLIQKNGCFKVATPILFPALSKLSFLSPQECRAGLENMIGKQLGRDIMEELFDRYGRKIMELEPPHTDDECVGRQMFLLLKRNA